MNEVIKFFVFIVAVMLLEIVSTVFSLLYMHYCSKYRNHKLSLGWYICGVIFGLWTLIVFMLKKSDFPGPDKKICWQCSAGFPASFKMCPKCCLDLPEIIEQEKLKQKKLSRVFGIGFLITYIASIACAVAMGITISSMDFSSFDDYSYTYRIDVDGLYYDKMGNSYEHESDVPLYGEDGSVYTYTAYPSEIDVLSEDYYYVNEDGEKFIEYKCYVTEDGWFYYDNEDLLVASDIGEDELYSYFDFADPENSDYRYYYFSYLDDEGNLYYPAYEASWNANGELITEKNDVSIVK